MVGRILGMVPVCEYLGWLEQPSPQHNQHGQMVRAKSTSVENSETAEACTFFNALQSGTSEGHKSAGETVEPGVSVHVLQRNNQYTSAMRLALEVALS